MAVARPDSPPDRSALLTWLAVFLAVGVAWRVLRYLACFPFWGDESFLNISILHRDFRGLLTPLEYFQVAPLAFLWLQRAALLALGPGEYSLRLLSLIAGLAAFGLIARFALRNLPLRAAVLAVGIFGGSYYLVRHTTEAKQYAVELFVGAAVYVAPPRWLARPTDARRFGLALSTGVLGVWCSNPAVFVVGGCGGVVALRAIRKRSVRGCILAALFALLTSASFGAYYFLFLQPTTVPKLDSWLVEYWALGFPPHTGVLDVLGWFLARHTGRMFAYPHGGPPPSSLLTAACFAAGIVAAARGRRRWLVMLLLAPFGANLIAAALGFYPYGASVRVSISFAMPICIFAGLGIDAVLRQFPAAYVPRAAGAVGVVLIGVPILGLARDLLFPAKHPAYWYLRAACERVAQATPRGVPLVCLNNLDRGGDERFEPMFEQTARFYIESSRSEPLHWFAIEPPAGPGAILLTYVNDERAPDVLAATETIRAAGLTLTNPREFRFHPDYPWRFELYDVSPIRAREEVDN